MARDGKATPLEESPADRQPRRTRVICAECQQVEVEIEEWAVSLVLRFNRQLRARGRELLTRSRVVCCPRCWLAWSGKQTRIQQRAAEALHAIRRGEIPPANVELWLKQHGYAEDLARALHAAKAREVDL